MERPFLTARWSNLVLASWAVPPTALASLMPPSCEADLLEGQAFVSLVAFDFEDTREHFFKEHDLGFGRSRRGALLTYTVEHPAWQVLTQPRLELDWSFAEVYGPEWALLDRRPPDSLVIAVGSEVAVSPVAAASPRCATPPPTG